MSELPSGTVTFLFCDVEGSTRLVRALGDRWGAVLSDYRRLVRSAVEERGGREVDRQGDGMFFVFPSARRAVAAAAAAQRALADHAWPEGAVVRVRMGLHTGEPGLSDEGYLGMDVVRAARICAAAHGGQVLVSATTNALLAGDPVEGIGTIYLGEPRLKDIPSPEPLHQLVIAGLETRFEQPRTDAGEAEPVPIAGREGEVARGIEDVLRDFRASIQEQVLDGLATGLGAPPDRRRAREEVEGPPTLNAALVMATTVVAIVAATILVLVWLLVR